MTIEEYDNLVRSAFTLFHKNILHRQLAEEAGQFENLSIVEWGDLFTEFLLEDIGAKEP